VFAYAAGAKDEKQSVDEKIATALRAAKIGLVALSRTEINTKRKIIIIRE